MNWIKTKDQERYFEKVWDVQDVQSMIFLNYKAKNTLPENRMFRKKRKMKVTCIRSE